MKLDPIYTCLSVAIAALLAWGGCTIEEHEALKLYVGVGMFLVLGLTGIGCVGFRYPNRRSGLMARTACGVTFVIALTMDYIFACFQFSIAPFVILNGLLLLLCMLIAVCVVRTGE